MLISDYVSYNNLCLFFDLTHFKEVRQKYKKNRSFLVQMKTLKFASEIYWPLDVESLDKSEETEKMLGFFGIVLLLLLLLWISLVVVGLKRYSRVIYQSLFTKMYQTNFHLGKKKLKVALNALSWREGTTGNTITFSGMIINAK